MGELAHEALALKEISLVSDVLLYSRVLLREVKPISWNDGTICLISEKLG